ncbi:DUF455-domain-containing protein [Clavulina sp. PMI_390]|nr:DUF455-domain-containing protein [Clavulina sp. PMI_390]
MADEKFVLLGPATQFVSHTRFLFTLRCVNRPSLYHSLLLFRLASLSPQELPSTCPATEKDESGLAEDLPGHDSSLHTSNSTINPSSKYGQMYVMESTCPHLGADLSHADIEEGPESAVAVCPWHKYDFDLKTGHSDHGIRACTYAVQLRPQTREDPSPAATPSKGGDQILEVWVEAPSPDAWEVVELRPVSEEFADPPPIIPTPTTSTAPLEPISDAGAESQTLPTTLLEWSVLILNTPNPDRKVERTRQAIDAFKTGKLRSIGRSGSNAPSPPDVPPREADLRVVAPGKVGKRGKAGSLKSRIVILHALANIEQWAIDLAWDIIARFANVKINGKPLPQQFFSDWTKVAQDEAKHFSLLRKRLEELGSSYGEHTVHAGLWESAQETAHSLSARLAIIHLVHEARGLDVNPATIQKFKTAGDVESVKVLEVIHHDEITHVTAGHRWLSWVCEQTNEDPVAVFRDHVRRHFSGAIKGPYNIDDRKKAGLTPDFYEDLQGELGFGGFVFPPTSGQTAATPVGYEVTP